MRLSPLGLRRNDAAAGRSELMRNKNGKAEQDSFRRVKRELLAFIESIRKENPEAAEYLKSHLVVDKEARTFMYTGDDRLQLRHVNPETSHR